MYVRVDVRGWLWAVVAKPAPAPRSAGQLAEEISIQPCRSLMPGGMQAISPCLVIATAMPSGQEPSCLSAPLISRMSPTVNEAIRNQTWAAMIAAATAATVSSRGAIRSRAMVCDTPLTLGGAPDVAYTSTGGPWVDPSSTNRIERYAADVDVPAGDDCDGGNVGELSRIEGAV